MSKEVKNKLLPKLRFPGFAKNGTWDKNQLYKLAEIKGRIGYRGYTINDIVKKGEGAISLSPSNIDDNGVLNFEKSTYISWPKYEESPEIILKEGYTVLVKTASVGKCAFVKYLPEKTTINPQLVVLKPFDVDPLFLSISISHLNIQKQIKANVGAGAIPNLSQDSISKFEVLIPPDKEKKEQQKIADCLSSLDDLLNAENQKLQVLQAHKKGLMQNLFPDEGETLPKLRFKGFGGKWKKEEFGNLIEIKGRIGYRGYTINDIVNKGEGAISLSPSNIDDNNTLNFEKSTYISWEKYYESPEIMLMDGYTVLVKTASVGKCAFVKYLPEKTTINPQLVVLKPTSIDSTFLFLIVSNASIQKQIRETVAGGAIPTLSQENISKFEVLIPPDKEKKEQQKIASCLSSLDELITAKADKIESLKLHKSGLMQNLFPKFNGENV